MRTFIALELPSDFITNIAQIEQDLQSSIQGHFVTENSLHLSLAFMGELKTLSLIHISKNLLNPKAMKLKRQDSDTQYLAVQ